jgi:hypothetical protein
MKYKKNIERVRKWQEEQKSKGLCIECSNPATGLRCDFCNKRRAEYTEAEWLHDCPSQTLQMALRNLSLYKANMFCII